MSDQDKDLTVVSFDGKITKINVGVDHVGATAVSTPGRLLSSVVYRSRLTTLHFRIGGAVRARIGYDFTSETVGHNSLGLLLGNI